MAFGRGRVHTWVRSQVSFQNIPNNAGLPHHISLGERFYQREP